MKFTELLDVAERERWCTRLFCTTCRADKFRESLRNIPKEQVIDGLRSLPKDYLDSHVELFRFVIFETSKFGVGGDLLGLLEGTAACEQLQANIEYQNREDARQKAYVASQTPEALAKLRAERKVARERATAPHRERKLASQEKIRSAARKLAETRTKDILSLSALGAFDVSPYALGEMVYERLINHYRKFSIENADREVLSKLAGRYPGYWAKLLRQIS